MSGDFFSELEIPAPARNLGLSGLAPSVFLSKAIAGLGEIIETVNPRIVLVYGDTDSTLAGALAALKCRTPLAHVEAGLRSGNREMAEEHNRILTDHACDLAFCPTPGATERLKQEMISGSAILTGDVMLDAFNRMAAQLTPNQGAEPYILATLHRAENVDDPEKLHSILAALDACSLPVVMPLHPRTRNRIDTFSINVGKNIRVSPPLSYLELMQHLADAKLVVTDSGGLQKEAYFMERICVVLRNETEWSELVTLGASFLAGQNQETIKETIAFALNIDARKTDNHVALFGDGNAGKKIAESLAGFLRR